MGQVIFHLVLPSLSDTKEEFDVLFCSCTFNNMFLWSSGHCTNLGRVFDANILLGGLTLLATSVIGYGFATEFWMLLLFSLLAGLEIFFHPQIYYYKK